ncbi:hypothetical protein C2845_PM13G26180 [Panicum miliaceum]|uniref:Uncharacterized protein n=1 Tax=Panicum miliaceum TaxID=4540 RepID=A0A3L6RKS9_PANMI|nr:hypothetical protein C2845_PM13G26180 [Panicum miliaceum]
MAMVFPFIDFSTPHENNKIKSIRLPSALNPPVVSVCLGFDDVQETPVLNSLGGGPMETATRASCSSLGSATSASTSPAVVRSTGLP